MFSLQHQQDFTDDDVSSGAYLFDINMEDFVTVDEVGDDTGVRSPGHRSSSSSRRSSLKDVDKSNNYIQSEDQPLEKCDNKYLDTYIDEQETFEILDSIDDMMEMEEIGEKLEASGDQMSKQDFWLTSTGTDSETDIKEKRTKKGEAPARKGDRSSRRSSSRTRMLKSEEREKSPKKTDRTVKKYETRTTAGSTTGVSKTCKNISEEMEFEIVDAVEEEPGQDADTTERSRRRSARGKREDKTALDLAEMSRKPVGSKEATYKILDSVDEETGDDKPTIITRSTRGRRERAFNKDASSEKIKKQDTPTRRRHTPARDSQEKTAKEEERVSPKGSSPTKKCDLARQVCKEDAVFNIIDSVGDEVKDSRPTTVAKGRRGRPRKYVETTKEDIVTSDTSNKDASDKVADEEATYQILDSVEDEVVDNKAPTEESTSVDNLSKKDNQLERKSTTLSGAPKTEQKEEEEPMYQIVDSLEEDQLHEESVTTEVSNTWKERSNAKDETCPKVEAPAEMPTRNITVMKAPVQGTSKTESCLRVDHLVDINDDSSKSDTATLGENMTQKSQDTLASVSTLVNLDEVSEEEEDYPDDTAEKETLRRRQAATKGKQMAKAREKGQEERKTRDREERERRCRSRNSDGGATRRSKERVRVKGEDTKELVTLDEVGADESGEERLTEGHEWDAEIMGGELQSLVTLDEIVDEEVEKVGRSSPCKDDASVDSLNPEVIRLLHADFIQRLLWTSAPM